jgi:hypothetical protein
MGIDEAFSNFSVLLMKPRCAFLTTGILLLLTLNVCPAQDSTHFKKLDLSIRVTAGFGQEALDWSIAGNLQGKNPNILSELIWEDVTGPVAELAVTLSFKRKVLLRIAGDYQKTISGNVTDSDYQGDDRTLQSFYADVDSDRGSAMRIAGELGYHFQISENYALQTWVGYVHDRSLLYLRDPESYGDQKLNSTYKNYWKGIILSLSGELKISSRLRLAPRFSYKQLRYDATANWNLIEVFMHPESFKHYAKGFGLAGEVETAYRLNKLVSLVLLPQYAFAETGKGTDTVFLQNGQIEKTQLNGVSKSNFKLTLGVSLKL